MMKNGYLMILFDILYSDTRVLKEINTIKSVYSHITILTLGEIQNDKYIHKKIPNVNIIPILKIHKHKRERFLTLLLFWIIATYYIIRKKNHFKIIHAHDLTALPIAFVGRVLNPNIKLIYDSHELFPEAAYEKINQFVFAVFLLIEKTCLTKINYVITVTQHQNKVLQKRMRQIIPYIFIRNFPTADNINEFNVSHFKRINNPSLFVVGVSGSVVKQRGYLELIDAANILINRDNFYRFLIIGTGALIDNVKQKIISLKLENYFEFTGHLNHDELLKRMSQVHMGIGIYEGYNANLSLSNKLFEYMCINIPFIFSNLHASKNVLKEINYPVFDSLDPIEIANKIENFKRIPIEQKIEIINRTNQICKEKFTWETEEKKLIDFIKSI